MLPVQEFGAFPDYCPSCSSVMGPPGAHCVARPQAVDTDKQTIQLLFRRERERERQTDRDRQTDRQTDRQSDRERWRGRLSVILAA